MLIKKNIKVVVIIPTLNAGHDLSKLLDILMSSSLLLDIFVVDSSSSDSTTEILQSHKIPFVTILRSDFNHGGTRQVAIDKFHGHDFAVFLTQDAVPASSSVFNELLLPFSDPEIAAVCGRQIPSALSTPIAAHARLFNYPARSEVRSIEDVSRLGLKAAFMSNSFAAYRISALNIVGGFPSDVIFGEDMIVAAKLLLNGWKVAYSANAIVHHSHNYSYLQEFKRYFDIGVLHSKETWLLERFGKAEGEGKKFVISEIKYLFKNSPFAIPGSIIRTGIKYSGYLLGKSESLLSKRLKRQLSMNRTYWS